MSYYQINWSWTDGTERWVSSIVSGFTLNVCCGMSKIGDVRVDIDKRVKPDVLGSVYYLPFKDGCFESVLCDPPFNYMKIRSLCLPLCSEVARVSREVLVITSLYNAEIHDSNWIKTMFVTCEDGFNFMRGWSIFKKYHKLSLG